MFLGFLIRKFKSDLFYRRLFVLCVFVKFIVELWLNVGVMGIFEKFLGLLFGLKFVWRVE